MFCIINLILNGHIRLLSSKDIKQNCLNISCCRPELTIHWHTHIVSCMSVLQLPLIFNCFDLLSRPPSPKNKAAVFMVSSQKGTCKCASTLENICHWSKKYCNQVSRSQDQWSRSQTTKILFIIHHFVATIRYTHMILPLISEG